MRSSAVSDLHAAAAAQAVKLRKTYRTRPTGVDALADVDVTFERGLAAVTRAAVRQPGIEGHALGLGHDHRRRGPDLRRGGYRHPAGSHPRNPTTSSP